MLKRLSAQEVETKKRDAVDKETLKQAASIVDEVRAGGEKTLRVYAEKFGDLKAGEKLIYSRADLQAALKKLPPHERELLERTHKRIERFALAQRQSLQEVKMPVPGGEIGHEIQPVERAGCYAPGGRFPLPSSVLMTVTTARAAGVEEVWVASPKPTVHTLAAAAIANADALIAVGGAQAIAALTYGAGEIPACDVIVGPGNRFVTAAKQCVAGHVAIDMLAGPSELLIVADVSSDAATIAADLLAQAEHDPDALPCLILIGKSQETSTLLKTIEDELNIQLSTLPTAKTAEQALKNGWCVECTNAAQAIEICNRVAPEHLQIMTHNAQALVPELKHFGALFIGHSAAEVLGDYGIGPNHVLPTGQSARFTGGLSVFNFLRIRTYLKLQTSSKELIEDAAALARLEGLEAHARAALKRRS